MDVATVAALFVHDGGVYFSVDGVDPWPESRDARRYRGPHRVVAHPPCKRWGRYWGGGPSAKVRRCMGDDEGCFAAALWSVRTFGGVIEHPEASHAWSWHGLPRPRRSGGWTQVDQFGGRSCCVEQGHYGHRARKATWLYAVGCGAPELTWGPSEGERLDSGFHSRGERDAATRDPAYRPCKRLSSIENISTPPAFAAVLLDLVRSEDTNG